MIQRRMIPASDANGRIPGNGQEDYGQKKIMDRKMESPARDLCFCPSIGSGPPRAVEFSLRVDRRKGPAGWRPIAKTNTEFDGILRSRNATTGRQDGIAGRPLADAFASLDLLGLADS